MKKLFFILTSFLIAGSVIADPDISKRHVKMAEQYGVTIEVDNFTRAENGKVLNQKILDSEMDIMFSEMAKLSPNMVRMCRCNKIKITGAHARDAYTEHGIMHFKYQTTHMIRRLLFKHFDLLSSCNSAWRRLNPEGFYYGRGCRGGRFQDLSLRQIAYSGEMLTIYAPLFVWEHAALYESSERTAIFEYLTSPDAKTRKAAQKKMKENALFRKKAYWIIGTTSYGTGMNFWTKLYNFSGGEISEIQKVAPKPERDFGAKIEFEKENMKVYGDQLRTVFALYNFPVHVVKSLSLRKIRFVDLKDPKERNDGTKISGTTLKIRPGDRAGLMKEVYKAYCKKRGKSLIGKFDDEFLEMYNGKIPVENAEKIIRGTANEFRDNYWADYEQKIVDTAEDEKYEGEFNKLGLRLVTEFPKGCSGTAVEEDDGQNGMRAVKAVCTMLDEKFVRETGIRKILFFVDMQQGETEIKDGITVGDTLCLKIRNYALVRVIYREFFLAYDKKKDNRDWEILLANDKKSSAFVSSDAKKSHALDRAYTFAYLMYQPTRVFNQAKNSKTLQQKIEYITSMKLHKQLPRLKPVKVKP